MPDLKSIENVQLVVWFVVPGLVALYCRAQFLTGRVPLTAEAILPYLSLSLICFALGVPIQQYVLPGKDSPFYLLGTLVVIFAIPALLGSMLGLSAQKGWTRRSLSYFGLTVVHEVPSAWDWKFSGTRSPEWVFIVLKNGTKFAGFFGKNSFASSDGKDRDLYIQETYDVDENNRWTPRESGTLFVADEISTIEFFPIEAEGNRA